MEVSLSWLYIVGANVDDRRKVIDKGKWKNDQRERVSTMKDAHTLDVFNRELRVSMCFFVSASYSFCKVAYS